MICPYCQQNGIGFWGVFLKREFGTFRCSACQGSSRLREVSTHTIWPIVGGALACAVSLLFGGPGWMAVAAYLVAAVLVDGFLASGHWMLDPYPRQPADAHR